MCVCMCVCVCTLHVYVHVLQLVGCVCLSPALQSSVSLPHSKLLARLANCSGISTLHYPFNQLQNLTSPKSGAEICTNMKRMCHFISEGYLISG